MAVSESTQATQRTVIEPERGWTSLGLRELWDYRELLYYLALRDVKVQYKQSALGIGWAVIQPIALMVVFSVVLGRFAGLPSGDVPYPLLTFAALLPWQLFASSVQRTGGSLVGNTNLVTKVYFPRLLIPLSALAVGLVDLLVGLAIFVALMVWYGQAVTVDVVALPVFMAFALVTALAIGLWLSALNVKYRDVTYVIPFLVQVGLFVSPVAYSADIVPDGIWRVIYSLNPMAGVIQGFRWALLEASPPDATSLISLGVVVLVLIGGLYYFRRMENQFADVV